MLGEERKSVVELFLKTWIGPAFREVQIAEQGGERNRLIDAGETIVLGHGSIPCLAATPKACVNPRPAHAFGVAAKQSRQTRTVLALRNRNVFESFARNTDASALACSRSPCTR